MKIPQMVLFDYGQTLIAEQVHAKANEINQEFGRFSPEKRHLFQIEIPVLNSASALT